jgi:polysaccharide pyruvyl transferase WcaK-like protein
VEYSNFGDEILYRSAEHFFESLKKENLLSQYEIFKAEPFSIGFSKCSENALIHIFWGGTQHYLFSNHKNIFQRGFYEQFIFQYIKLRKILNYKIEEDKKIIFIASGFGPFEIPFSPLKRYVKKLIRKSIFISVRDKESLKFVNQVKNKKSTQNKIISDPSILIFEKYAAEFNHKEKAQDLIICPRNWTNDCKNLEQIELIIKLRDIYGSDKIKIFYSSPEDEYFFAEYLQNIDFLTWNGNIEDVHKFIKTGRVVLSARLHVGIFAKIIGIKTAFFNIEPKMIRNAEYYDCPTLKINNHEKVLEFIEEYKVLDFLKIYPQREYADLKRIILRYLPTPKP